MDDIGIYECMYVGLYFQINMSDKRRFVYSILKFVASEMEQNELSDDAKESLEVIFPFVRLFNDFSQTFSKNFMCSFLHI